MRELDFDYPDLEEEALRTLATDLHICLSKDLGRAWPKVREISLENGQSSLTLKLDCQDDWILSSRFELVPDSDNESWV